MAKEPDWTFGIEHPPIYLKVSAWCRTGRLTFRQKVFFK